MILPTLGISAIVSVCLRKERRWVDLKTLADLLFLIGGEVGIDFGSRIAASAYTLRRIMALKEGDVDE